MSAGCYSFNGCDENPKPTFKKENKKPCGENIVKRYLLCSFINPNDCIRLNLEGPKKNFAKLERTAPKDISKILGKQVTMREVLPGEDVSQYPFAPGSGEE